MQKIPYALKIFMQAERFLKADHYLRTNDDPEHMNVIAVPSLVISALACELYLKCLVSIEKGTAPPIHLLDSLFRKLKPKTQDRIRELWAEFLLSPQEV